MLPARQVELAAPMEEILWSVDVEESDRVVKGQVLAKLYYELQEVVVEAAQVRAASTAEIDRATLNIEDAQLTFDRITRAFEQDAANGMFFHARRICSARFKTFCLSSSPRLVSPSPRRWGDRWVRCPLPGDA